MFFRVLNYLKGTVTLRIGGRFPERFLNLCALDNIHLRKVKKSGDFFNAECSVKAFRKMRGAAKKSGCKVKILKKSGLGFFLQRYKRRKALIVGAAVFAFVLLISNCFVWTIRIEGNEIMTEEEIKFVAEYCGLKQGVVKYKINKEKFQADALRYEPRISWIYPEIKGTVLYIYVREKTFASKPVDVKSPCNVIAGKSGRINSVTVKRGTATVKEGDFVSEGTVLITGERAEGEYLHADGEVLASRWIRQEGEAALKEAVTSGTGREKTRYSVEILGFGMGLYFSGKAPYELYEKSESSDRVRIFGDVFLPITVKKVNYREVVRNEVALSEEEAVEKTKKRLYEELQKNIPNGAKIKETADETVKENGKIKVAVIAEYEENIALTEYIFTEE